MWGLDWFFYTFTPEKPQGGPVRPMKPWNLLSINGRLLRSANLYRREWAAVARTNPDDRDWSHLHGIVAARVSVRRFQAAVSSTRSVGRSPSSLRVEPIRHERAVALYMTWANMRDDQMVFEASPAMLELMRRAECK